MLSGLDPNRARLGAAANKAETMGKSLFLLKSWFPISAVQIPIGLASQSVGKLHELLHVQNEGPKARLCRCQLSSTTYSCVALDTSLSAPQTVHLLMTQPLPPAPCPLLTTL